MNVTDYFIYIYIYIHMYIYIYVYTQRGMQIDEPDTSEVDPDKPLESDARTTSATQHLSVQVDGLGSIGAARHVAPWRNRQDVGTSAKAVRVCADLVCDGFGNSTVLDAVDSLQVMLNFTSAYHLYLKEGKGQKCLEAKLARDSWSSLLARAQSRAR